MSIKNRINRVIKDQKKKARKAYLRRMGVLAQAPQAKKRRMPKERGYDGTMYGTFKQRGYYS